MEIRNIDIEEADNLYQFMRILPDKLSDDEKEMLTAKPEAKLQEKWANNKRTVSAENGRQIDIYTYRSLPYIDLLGDLVWAIRKTEDTNGKKFKAQLKDESGNIVVDDILLEEDHSDSSYIILRGQLPNFTKEMEDLIYEIGTSHQKVLPIPNKNFEVELSK